MSAPGLTPEQERLLERLAARDVDRASAEIAEAARDPAFAAALGRLDDVIDALEHSASVEELERAGAGSGEPFRGADEAVRSQLARLTNRAGPARRGWFVWIAAAALLVGAIGWALWWDAREEQSPQFLGAGDLVIEGPKGVVEGGYGVFSWVAELPPRGFFVVRIFDGQDRQTLIEESGNLVESSWTPRKVLPDTIYWEVRTYDAKGDDLRSWQGVIAERR